jgi:hypothetical protein
MRAAGPLSPGDSRGHLPGESPPALSSVEAARWGVLLDPQTLPVDRGLFPAGHHGSRRIAIGHDPWLMSKKE